MLRLSLDQRFDPETAPKGLKEALVQAASIDPEIAHPGLDIETLGGILSQTQESVAKLFDLHCPADMSSNLETGDAR